MTTTTTTASTGPLTASGTAPLPFTFQALSATEIMVTRDGIVAATDSYTVTLNGDDTGSITPLATWGSDEVYIYSAPNYQQPSDFGRFAEMFPDALNGPLDRLARSTLALRDYLLRTTTAMIAAIPAAPKGDPGGNVMAIGLFTAAAALSISLGTDLVRTAGYAAKGVGAAEFVADAAVDAAYVAANPRSSFISANGRGFRIAQSVLEPEMVGARGDNATDDSAAMRAWAAADASLHRLTKGKTYLVAPATAGAIILPFTGKRTIVGEGATIKVKASSGEYLAILGSNSFSDDLSGTRISGVTFDYNRDANTYGVTSSLLNNAHNTFIARKGTDIDVSDNIIIGAMTTNSIYLNGWASGGSVQNIKRARINRNKWLDTGGGATYFDHSTIYFHGEGLECFGNEAVGNSMGANGTKCFLEPHGTLIRASYNEVRNFEGFANVTGIYSGGDTERSQITHNTGDVLQFGIRIFSQAYQDHSSGYGINGLNADDNNFRIRQTQLQSGTSRTYGGVFFQAGSTLPVKDVSLSRNTVTYDEETVAASYTATSCAIGVNETSGSTVFENLVIDNNMVINAPDAAFALGYSGGVFKNCAITATNRAINPAQGKTVVTAGYAIVLFGVEYQGFLEVGCKVFDTFATSRLVGGAYSNPTNSSTSCLVRSDLDVYLTGTVLSSYGRAFRNGGGKLAPFLAARQNKAVNTALSDQTGFKPGSSVTDLANGGVYKVHVAGGVFANETYIAAINSTSGVTYTTAVGDLFNVRRFTSNVSPITVTIAPNATVPMPVGAWMEFEQAGSQPLTVAGGAGVTLLGTLTTAAQYQVARFRQVAVDTWVRYQ